jgi:hypothetical protein
MRKGRFILFAMAVIFLLVGIASAANVNRKQEEEEKKPKFVKKWSLGLVAGPYQPIAPDSSTGFSVNMYLRYRFHRNFADDTSIGYTQFQYNRSSTSTVQATVREVPLINTLVVFLAPGETFNPYLKIGPGAFFTHESWEEGEKKTKDNLTPGALGGAGLIITTEDFGLNLSGAYILPDFSDTERGAISYGIALGFGF